MNKLYILGVVVLYAACYALTSCNDNEEVLTASGIESGYTVSPGKHDYDATIVDFHKKYGSYLLYQFTDKDTYWTPSGWKNGILGPLDATPNARTGYLATPANEEYVGKQLKLLNALLFNFYTEDFLKKFLPVKILLCSKVQNCDWSFFPVFSIVGIEIPAYYNYDNICLSYGSSAIENISKNDSSSIAQAFNRCLIESMIGRGVSQPTKDFSSSVSYSNTNDLTTDKDCWARGLFPPYYSISVQRDWQLFLYMMVSYPESYLTREPTTEISDQDNTETAWEGILNSVKDTNGLIKKRYNIVRDYFITNYKMDLQIVGNYNKNY